MRHATGKREGTKGRQEARSKRAQPPRGHVPLPRMYPNGLSISPLPPSVPCVASPCVASACIGKRPSAGLTDRLGSWLSE